MFELIREFTDSNSIIFKNVLFSLLRLSFLAVKTVFCHLIHFFHCLLLVVYVVLYKTLTL